MYDEEDDDNLTAVKPTFVKKRSRNRPRAPASGSASASASTSRAVSPRADKGGGDDEGEEEDAGVVRRSNTKAGAGPSSFGLGLGRKRGGGIPARVDAQAPATTRPAAAKKGLSFADDGAGADAAAKPFRLRPSASAATLPTSLDQASIHAGGDEARPPSPSAADYSADYLAALKASTPSASAARTRAHPSQLAHDLDLDEDGNPILLPADADAADGDDAAPAAFQTLPDPMQAGDSRLRFGAAHLDAEAGHVPSQSVIQAAKERRRRAALAAGNEIGQDEFVPLESGTRSGSGSQVARPSRQVGAYQGPHPESTLQREEDDLGSGEDEYAAYTGAGERIALGKQARREDAARARRERAELLAGESASDGEGSGSGSEAEFERAQLRRAGGVGGDARKRREAREPSPYAPAPLPPILPLPSASTSSTRLALRLARLESAHANHEALAADAEASLAQLERDEEANKAEVGRASEKEGWAREMEGFVQSLAGLLEEKVPRMERLAGEWVGLLRRRTREVQRGRARAMEDEAAIVWGVPRRSLLPPAEAVSRSWGPAGEARMDVDDPPQEEEDDEEGEHDPVQDGDAFSPIRIQRRAAAAGTTEGSGWSATTGSLAAAAARLRAEHAAIMADVRAVEYRWPDARLQPANASAGGPATGLGGTSPQHPASVHARFSAWRRLFPAEYAQAWGSLALAGVWEGYARWECGVWDPLGPSPSVSEDEPLGGARQGEGQGEGEGEGGWTPPPPRDIESSASLTALQHWIEAAQEADTSSLSGDPANAGDPDAGRADAGPLGGDDEAPSSLVSSVFVPRLLALAESGAYDPYSAAQTARAIRLARQVGDFLDRRGVRVQSLLAAYLTPFKNHFEHVASVLALGPAMPPPGPQSDINTSGSGTINGTGHDHDLAETVRLARARLCARLFGSPSPSGALASSGSGSLLSNLALWRPLLHPLPERSAPRAAYDAALHAALEGVVRPLLLAGPMGAAGVGQGEEEERAELARGVHRLLGVSEGGGGAGGQVPGRGLALEGEGARERETGTLSALRVLAGWDRA